MTAHREMSELELLLGKEVSFNCISGSSSSQFFGIPRPLNLNKNVYS